MDYSKEEIKQIIKNTIKSMVPSVTSIVLDTITDRGVSYPQAAYLENGITQTNHMPFSKEDDQMAKQRIKRRVVIGGVERWVTGETEQEYAENLLKASGVSNGSTHQTGMKHDFKEYASNWFNVYSKPNVATVTATTYERQLKNSLYPAFAGKAVEDITVEDVQRLFNGLQGARATKNKARIVLNMVLTQAVEDGLLAKNPLKSNRLRITGKPSKPTETYTREQMKFLTGSISKVAAPTDRMYLALQAFHPLRLEEVLGLTWGDIDMACMVLHIRRAVTHPTRNQPEIKSTKTESSVRDIGIAPGVEKYFTGGKPDEFVIGGARPYSYQQVKRMCERIQRDTGFAEKITPIRFRTTVLTDIYDATKDVKATQAAAGHTTAAMTMKYYVKGREQAKDTACAIADAYGLTRAAM